MAGKAKRAAAAEKRRKSRRAAKDARKTLYASLRGTSKKNKKINKKGARIFTGKKHKHLMANCGNPACRKCGVERTISKASKIS